MRVGHPFSRNGLWSLLLVVATLLPTTVVSTSVTSAGVHYNQTGAYNTTCPSSARIIQTTEANLEVCVGLCAARADCRYITWFPTTTACRLLRDDCATMEASSATPAATYEVFDPVNCTVGNWTANSACSAACGGGEMSMTRAVTVSAAYGGVGCPALTKMAQCNVQACAAQDMAPGQNLLCNPSGETPLAQDACWYSVGTNPLPMIKGEDYPQRAVHGTYVIGTGVDKQIYTYVSVGIYKIGQPFLFTGYMSSLNDEREKGRIMFEWLDADDNLVSSSASLIYPLQYQVVNTERWFYYSHTTVKPVGATLCKISLIALDHTDGNDMIWDALSFAPNLLHNPSGEYAMPESPVVHGLPEIAGWKSNPSVGGTNQSWTQVPKLWKLSDTFLPQNGAVFLAPPSNTDEASLYQEVDTRAYPVGTVFLIESQQASVVYEGHSDHTTVKIQWKASNGTSVYEELVSFQTFTTLEWGRKQYLRPKPQDGDVFVFTIISKREKFWHGGHGNRGMFDALYFGPADHHAVFSTTDLRMGEVHIRDPGFRVINISNTGVFSYLEVSDALLNQTYPAGNFTLTVPPSNYVAPRSTSTWVLGIDNTYPTDWVANLFFTLVDPDLPVQDIPISCTITAQLAAVDSTTLDFGSKYWSRGSSNLQIRLESVGIQPLIFTGVTTNFDGTGFSMQGLPNLPLTLNPRSQTQLSIQFDPSQFIGLNSGSFILHTNDFSNTDIVISVTGVSDNYQASVLSQSIQFGQQHVFSGNKTMPFNITNVGQSGTLEITSITIAQSDCAQFSINDDSAVSLTPGQDVDLEITFNPIRQSTGQAYGNAFCNMEIATNDQNTAFIFITLQAYGSDQTITADTMSLDLGQQHILWSGGNNFRLYNLYIRNSGSTGVLALKSFTFRTPLHAVTGGINSSFVIVNGANPNNNMGPGSLHQLQMMFFPILDATGPVGIRNATLEIESDDPVTPILYIQLSGDALDPKIELDITSWDFGDNHVSGGPSFGKVFAIKNVGINGDLVVQNAPIEGSENNNFFVSAGQPSNLRIAPGEYHNITVKFSPNTIGVKTDARLVIRSNDLAQEYATLALSGRGVNPRMRVTTPTSISFAGEYDTDAPASDPQYITIQNDGNLGDLVVETISITGQYASQFILNTTGQGPLAPGASFTYQVIFKPTLTGYLFGSVDIKANDANNNMYINLEGRGVHPKLKLSTSVVEFGTWDVTAGPRLFTGGNQYYALTLTNNGTTDLRFTSFVLTVNPSNSYALQSNGNGQTINSGQSAQVNIAWDPNPPNGLQAGVLSLISNDYLNSTVNVSLIGHAIQELAANAPFLGNISFTPPFAGRASTISLLVYTSDAGLPSDGKLVVDMPYGFDARDATVSIDGVMFGRDRVSVSGTELVTVSILGSGLPSITSGAFFRVDIYDVILPTYADCQANYQSWRWNITTEDVHGSLLEFAFEANLPGEICVAPKYYNISASPTLTTPPAGLQSGDFVRFTIGVAEPDTFIARGMPLLDTSAGGDKVKIIAAYKDGFPQYCSAAAKAEGAAITFSEDLGNLDDASLISCNFSTAFTPGQWRLCYYQAGGVFGWEQVGDALTVGEKLLADGSVPNLHSVEPLAVPESMDNEWWSGFSIVTKVVNDYVIYGDVLPDRTIVNETVPYTFTGTMFKSDRQIYAKVAWEADGCGGYAPGTPMDGVLIKNSTASFNINHPSLYKVCIRERGQYWTPLADLWVRTVVQANLPTVSPNAFAGFHTCAAYMEHFAGRCGCFYGDGSASVMTVDPGQAVDMLVTSVAQNQTLNQGCCAASSTRYMVKDVHPKWGYCQ